MGKPVNQRELAEILGISERTLLNWRAEGMPIQKQGGEGLANIYDTADVMEWRVAQAIKAAKLEKPRDRLSELQAQRLEIELAEKRAELIPADQITPAGLMLMGAIRKAFLEMAVSVVPAMEQLVDVDAKTYLLDETIRETLHELAVNSDYPGIGTVDGQTRDADGGNAGPAEESLAVEMGRAEPENA